MFSSSSAAPSSSSSSTSTSTSSGSVSLPQPVNVDPQQLKEYRFLSYVTSGNAVEGDAKSVLSAIDKYAWQQEWAMNLGDIKARIVESVVKNQLRVAANRPVIGLEIGAYMGYSAIHFSSLLPPNSLFLSLEINPLYAAVASKMLEFAHTNADHGAAVQTKVMIGTLASRGEDVRKHIRHFRSASETSSASSKKSNSDFQVGDSLDLIFIDHWKDQYVSDFLLLENLGFIGKGTVIIADNIVFPGAPEYLALLRSPEKAKLYESQLHQTQLEYSNKPDAVLVSIRK